MNIGAIIFSALMVSQAHANPIYLGGTCNLTRAIIAAEHDRPVKDCTAGNGPDLIVMQRDRDIFPSTPYPTITTNINIGGNRSSIHTEEPITLFTVDGGSLTLRNLSVSGGLSAVRVQGRLNANGLTVFDTAACGIALHAGSTASLKSTISSGNESCGISLNRSSLTSSFGLINDNPIGIKAVDSFVTFSADRNQASVFYNQLGVDLVRSAITLENNNAVKDNEQDFRVDVGSSIIAP